ncbi:MAG: hypothetical protein AVDCRST_MAG53-1061 [uncultured Solirubrobacteraceae bacterium]|uniref:Uncharacterized protein n=1 Tax=uncultured Solirubrobacteraceae bacterium TaxID=1162706 RepID=A0A6J4S6Y7_9ACTN|nr:MAG: hypothetical protein AVDCRST_MAG53-1061 [uncultured Solirubrobacteraceae bacterium]
MSPRGAEGLDLICIGGRKPKGGDTEQVVAPAPAAARRSSTGSSVGSKSDFVARLSELARAAVIKAITTDAPADSAPGPVTAAVALRAVLPQTDVLSEGERGLLREWLARITDASR